MNLFKGTFFVKKAALRASQGYGFELNAELDVVKLGPFQVTSYDGTSGPKFGIIYRSGTSSYLSINVDGAVSFLNFIAVKVLFNLQYANGMLTFDGVGRIEFTPKLFLEVQVKYSQVPNSGLFISAAFDNRAGEMEDYLKQKVQAIKYVTLFCFESDN